MWNNESVEALSWDEMLAQFVAGRASTAVLCRIAHDLDASASISSGDVAKMLAVLSTTYLTETTNEVRWILGLCILHRLARAACAEEAHEGTWLALVLQVPAIVVHDHATLAMGAGRSMVETWSELTRSRKPCTRILEIECASERHDEGQKGKDLESNMERGVGGSQNQAKLALTLYAIERALGRVTPPVLEEELHVTVPLVHSTLRDPHVPVRRACVCMLVHAYARLADKDQFRRIYAPLSAGEERLILVRWTAQSSREAIAQWSHNGKHKPAGTNIRTALCGTRAAYVDAAADTSERGLTRGLDV